MLILLLLEITLNQVVTFQVIYILITFLAERNIWDLPVPLFQIRSTTQFIFGRLKFGKVELKPEEFRQGFGIQSMLDYPPMQRIPIFRSCRIER